MGERLDRAVVSYYPNVRIPTFNHAADINVSEKEISSLVSDVSKFFESKGIPFVSFFVTPATRPRSFASILLQQGFKVGFEHSMMAFEGQVDEEKMNPEIEITDIPERDYPIFTELMFKIFDMPSEWMNGFNQLALARLRKGVKCYIAYLD